MSKTFALVTLALAFVLPAATPSRAWARTCSGPAAPSSAAK
jgi:hypothetical protein